MGFRLLPTGKCRAILIPGGMDMPFDGKRMIRGGFTPMFEGN